MSTWPGLGRQGTTLELRSTSDTGYTSSLSQANILSSLASYSWSIFLCYRKNQSNKFLSGLLCIIKEFPQKFELMRYLVTLKLILFGGLHTLLYHESETWGSSSIESSWAIPFSSKYDAIFASNSLDLGFWEDDSADILAQGVSNSCITACSWFLPGAASSFPCMTSPSACCAFFKIALLSSSFLLMAIHACIPVFAWPSTEHPKMWAAALEVQQQLKVLSQ